MDMEEIKYLSVRTTVAELAHLDELARRTGRNRSEVVRLLMRRAMPREEPDIMLSGGSEPVSEVRHG